jgi:deoxyribodipyrimidine photo-lyase
MHKKVLNIVWLKRDIRSQDHKVLYEAERLSEPYIIVYLFEPYIIKYQDCSPRHLGFIYQSLEDLKDRLNTCKRRLYVLYGDSPEIFSYLFKNYNVKQLISHEEYGTAHSWKRDKRINQLCKDNNIKWLQFPKDNVIRAIKNRKHWDAHWNKEIAQEVIFNRYSAQKIDLDLEPYFLPDRFVEGIRKNIQNFQSGGETKAWQYLESFAEERGKNYHRKISKPLESRKSCSRLSPYLAWGNLSIKQVYQFISRHENFKSSKAAFGGMLTRLKWRSHFIQKFEVECSYETICINRAYEKMPKTQSQELLNAWKEGRTGYPMVDANMRCLIQTGWINFRMRAMLVSFLCHHLDIDWRSGVYHMARLFLDYEPGIHYPQFQMQAGTTGVNTVRIYNPVKQAKDHDPNAQFIRQWVPELSALPEPLVYEPWKATEMEQSFYGFTLGKDYPKPIVPLEEAARRARDKIWSFRKRADVLEEARRILRTHTRRRTIQD